ncbi:Serine/threonine-protein kinase PrkC [Streptomyces hundungensis]|uniref:Serine/threonine-protein kinase PrkC n=1 Tax=Streptomyces hundungensis TaxID=1077946 RepID=A0A387HRX8_9ACTN|nr:serine/threonine-protein kinase [Streptomyces hundungensis]AYG84632.1 Serine/threonine-protein kinase PrkC [Streptomyces hundungensis]
MRGPADTSGSDRAELLPPGYRVDRWVVTEPIGSGGWATVYAGRPVEEAGEGAGQESVALKVLPTAGLSPHQARKVAETARREVEFGRRSSHPRLIRLLDTVVLGEPDDPLLDGAIVLVMERAERSLRDLLGTGVREAEAARLVTGICEGLAHLHRSGWVHGDLKPDNILLMADGSVKLSDFGLVTPLTGTHGTHGYAPPMGTFDYLPPERWKAPLGERGVEVRPSADIWALGITLYELFGSGSSPFPGATPMARGAATQEYADGRAPLRLDGTIAPFWRALVTDCLAPTHAARAPHTAESLLARIGRRPAPGPDTAEPSGPSGRSASRGADRNPVALRRRRAAFMTLAACAVGATIWPHLAPGSASGARADEPTGRIKVFNVERTCRDRTDRDPECSLGLAIDPMRPYTIDNVVETRVWHGDELAVDCRLADGMPIIDETDAHSAAWYRVRIPRGSGASTAWLPAIRTKDRPSVPDCPPPTPSRR